MRDSFSSSQRFTEAADLARRLYESYLQLLQHCVAGSIRFIGIGVTDLIDCELIQVNFFTQAEDEHLRHLTKMIDTIQQQYGSTSIFRAVSLSPSGMALE